MMNCSIGGIRIPMLLEYMIKIQTQLPNLQEVREWWVHGQINLREIYGTKITSRRLKDCKEVN
jgi:hypothetical protein